MLPLFYDEMANLNDYLLDHVVIYDNLSLQSIAELEKSYEDFYHARVLSNKANPDSFYFAISPDQLIHSSDFIKELLNSGDNLFIDNENVKESYSTIPTKIRGIQPLHLLDCSFRGNDKGNGDEKLSSMVNIENFIVE